MPRGGYRPGSGRPKGSTNTLGGVRADVVRLCKEKNYDPIKELIDIAQSDDPMVPLNLVFRFVLMVVASDYVT